MLLNNLENISLTRAAPRRIALTLSCLSFLAAIALTATDSRGALAGRPDVRVFDYGQLPPLLSEPVEATNQAFAVFAQTISSSATPLGQVDIVRLPVMLPDDRRIDPPQSTSGEPCLDSPWARLARSSDGRLNGTIYWNERQFLRDRTIEANWPELPQPATQTSFNALADHYIHGDPAAQSRIPIDLLQLFKEAPQSTRGPFVSEAQGTMPRIAAEMSPVYADQVLALIRYCVQGKASITLNSIKDLRTAFGRSAYTDFQK